MEAAPASPTAIRLDAFFSQKLRFWSLVAMVLLVYVHAFNLHPRYLQPWTMVEEPLAPDTFVQYFLANGLLRFRIPILFAISGYLFAWQEGRAPQATRLKKRVRTLLVPYLLWSALGLGLALLLEQFPVTRAAVLAAQLSPFGAKLVSEYSVGELLLVWLLTPVPFQLWFLRSLLIYNLLYPWLRQATDVRPAIYFAVAGLLWLGGIHLIVVEGEGLLFFGLGVWLCRRRADVQQPPRWYRRWLWALLWVGAAALKTWLAFAAVPPPFGVMLLLHKLTEAAGVLTAWFGLDGLVRAAMRFGWFRWLTGFSFMIYALHVPLVNYATELALRAWPGRHLPVYLLLPLAVALLAVALGAALRRLAPNAYSVLTGGRGL